MQAKSSLTNTCDCFHGQQVLLVRRLIGRFIKPSVMNFEALIRELNEPLAAEQAGLWAFVSFRLTGPDFVTANLQRCNVLKLLKT